MTDTARLKTALADRYRIERELGQGGMATVYLAADIKHDRKVALKVLKPELAAVIGAERFVVEIKTTAALQHPHILPLFDSGNSDGFLYYVMPYIEGETLRAKLDRETQFGVDEAVKLTSAVADALDYAHRHGVIHRDIKPENILLHDGRPMVADFGIALALSAAAGGRMTETGMSLGTPHYMSPEQATADKEITGRSDIYSLASMLYEMLTGNPPHTGATAQQIIMKIIAEPVAPVTQYRKSVPPNVADAVAQALEKLPADRFATAAEFALALRDVSYHGTGTGPRGTTRLPVPRLAAAGRDWRLWAGAAALVIIAAAAGRWSGKSGRPHALVARFTLEVDSTRWVTRLPVNALALSPDGQTIVYVGSGANGGQTQLYTRRLDESVSRPVPGTEGATIPVFSPGGGALSYVGPGGIFVLDVPLTGGASSPVVNGKAQALSTTLWADDRTLLNSDPSGGITRTTLDGRSESVAVPDRSAGEQNLFLEAILPGGKTVLVIPSKGLGIIGAVVAIDVRTGARTQVLDGPVNGVWYADGCLIWGELTGTLRAAPFDVAHLRLSGTAITVAEGVQQQIGGGPQAAVSPTGSLVYVPESPLSLVMVDRNGKRQVLLEGRRYHS